MSLAINNRYYVGMNSHEVGGDVGVITMSGYEC